MKTYYELLNVEPSADAEAVKSAFRREIGKYHPDKVTHLGVEFQEIASARAAELTAAYKVLIDPALRAQYDETLKGEHPAPAESAPAPPVASESYERVDQEPVPFRRFEDDRASRDDIMRRATLARVREALMQAVGDCELRMVRGFDLACVPNLPATPKLPISRLFKRPVTPNVLAVFASYVDAKVTTDAFSRAIRVRLHSNGMPVAVLLIGNMLAPVRELARAIDEARKKSPATVDAIFPIPIDIRDWSARMPANAPAEIRALVDRLKSSV